MEMNKVKKLAVVLLAGIATLYVSKYTRETRKLASTSSHVQNHDYSTTPSKLLVDSNESTSSVITSPTANSNGDFTFSKDFTFPHPKSLSTSTIIGNDHHTCWIEELKSILRSWRGEKRLIMVTSNSAYKDVLLNWLLSAILVARVSLDQILIVSLDEHIRLLMQERDLSSIYVPSSSLFPNSLNISPFSQIMMTRISVLRLLNHWKFDVIMIDTDALLLKNPWPLLEQFPDSDIVASMGRFPSELSTRWGTALCVGAILFRSSSQTGSESSFLCHYIIASLFNHIFTEDFWKETGKIQPKSYSDQGRINYGLEALGVRWESTTGDSFEGECVNKLKVNTLPYSQVCRNKCIRKQLNSYYIWHKPAPRDGSSKRRSALLGDIWLLSPTHWNLDCENLKREEWLNCIHH